MLQPLSQAEIAFRDTLVHRAEGGALDQLATFFGFPRDQSVFPIPVWREALKAVAFGARGTLPTLLAVLDALFPPQESFSVTVSSANPQRMSGAGFNASHVGRVVVIDGIRYFSVAGAAGTVDFSRFPGHYWQGMGWTNAVPATKTARFADYLVFERTLCLTEVWLSSQNTAFPATYMRTSGEARPGTEPFGGQVLATAVDIGDPNDDLGLHLPHPLYLAGDEKSLLAEILTKILPSGCWLSVRFVNWLNAGLGY